MNRLVVRKNTCLSSRAEFNLSQRLASVLLSFHNRSQQPRKKIVRPQINHLKSNLLAFTLVELLVTLCVLGIVLMIAVPAFRTMLLNNRLIASKDALVNSINFARGTALHDAINIKVCPIGSLNSTNCGTNWSSGWIVVTEPASGAATLLKSYQYGALDPNVSSNNDQIVFSSRGLTTSQTNFTFCDSRGASVGRSVVVMPTGYVQSDAAPGQAAWNNGALTCP